MGNQNITSLADLFKERGLELKPLETKFGFDFVPSTLMPTKDNFYDDMGSPVAFEVIRQQSIARYDACILDCHAGFSAVVLEAVRISDRNLVVLEPDAISSASIRALYLRLAEVITASNTWQIFNKLTEEERPIYEKIFGGTIFPNLPPIPFDWQVRAAFSVRAVPGVMTESSAFGLECSGL